MKFVKKLNEIYFKCTHIKKTHFDHLHNQNQF